MNIKRAVVMAAVLGSAYFVSPVALADIVHNDDVIIIGSDCVGIDCVDGENFGFDTLRLKENNLRIHFDDTSNSAGFPANDWRIIINETGNGGANHFSVEDSTAVTIPFRIEAGASNNALVVNSNSNIGIGTIDPVVQVHTVDGNTPTLRLEQDGSSGFSAQTWDVAGNEANFFVRDVTNSSALPFRIKPGSDSDSIHIAPGVVGIGTSTPDSNAALHIEKEPTDNRAILANGEVAVIYDNPVSLFRFKNSATGQTWRFTMLADGSFQMKDQTNAGGALIQLKPDGSIRIRGDVDIEGALTCNGGSC